MNRTLSWGARSAWVVIGLLPVAAFAGAQSLGDVARREREHRELLGKKAGKVYTSDDFPSVPPGTAEAPDPRPPAVDDKEPAAKVDEAELEKQWRRRFAEAHARLRRAELNAWQTRIKTVFVGGGRMSGLASGGFFPVQTQVREFVETEELRQARKALDDLEVVTTMKTVPIDRTQKSRNKTRRQLYPNISEECNTRDSPDRMHSLHREDVSGGLTLVLVNAVTVEVKFARSVRRQ